MRGLVEARVVSGVLLALGVALLVPLALSLLYRDGSWASFLLPAAAMTLVGGVGLRVSTALLRTPRYVSNRDVYLSVTLAWVVAALLGGVPFLIEGTFDSLLDSTFEAMSGFTTTGSTLLSNIEAQTPSILFWRSMTQWLGGIGIVVLFVAIAPVIGGFMVASGASFSLYYLLYTRRRFDIVLDRELLAYLGILLGAVLLVWGLLVFEGVYGASWGRALRDSAFSVVSITTTTGFVTADFDKWDTAAKLILVLLMFVGGCAGSTAGGIKVIRVIVIFRTILQDIFRMVHPRAVTPLVVGGRMIPEGVRLAVLGLSAAWIAIFGAASVLVALQDNLTLTSSATAVAATLNVIGPGLGQVGATESYEIVDPFGRVVLTVCMLLGRLELFTALALLSPAFWKR